MSSRELLVAWSALAAIVMFACLTAALVLSLFGLFVQVVSLSVVAIAAAACYLLLEWGRP